MPTKFCETVTFCFFLHIACVLKSYVASTPIARDEDTSDTYCSIGSTEQHGSTTNVTFAEIMKIRPASLAYGHELYNVRRDRSYQVPMPYNCRFFFCVIVVVIIQLLLLLPFERYPHFLRHNDEYFFTSSLEYSYKTTTTTNSKNDAKTNSMVEVN